MLHECHLVFGLAEKRRVERDDALALPLLELLAIEHVDVGMVAAEEQQRWSRGLAVGVAQGSLLQEPAERREPRSGADHDDGRAVERRRTKRNIGRADGDRHLIVGAQAREETRAGAMELPLTRPRW